MEIPAFVKDEFADFYRDMFAPPGRRENGMRAVFLEYAWDMGWCDPCAADPLSAASCASSACSGSTTTGSGRDRPIKAQARDVFVTRLHVRYDAEHFPEDLVFQETGDRTNFQGRYVMRHPWTRQPARVLRGRTLLRASSAGARSARPRPWPR